MRSIKDSGRGLAASWKEVEEGMRRAPRLLVWADDAVNSEKKKKGSRKCISPVFHDLAYAMLGRRMSH